MGRIRHDLASGESLKPTEDISLDTLLEGGRAEALPGERAFAPEVGKPSADIVHVYTRATDAVADHAA
jgi:hypothetical protein